MRESRESAPLLRTCSGHFRQLDWRVVKEIDDARLQGILRPDDQETIGLDQPLENLRTVTQMVNRCPDVGADRVARERALVVPEIGLQQRLHGWTNAVHDVAQISRLVSRRRPESVQRRLNPPDLRMDKHVAELGPELCGGEFPAADLRGRGDVADHADDEQIAEPLVEYELGGHSRVRAAKNDGERLLAGGQLAAAEVTRLCV